MLLAHAQSLTMAWACQMHVRATAVWARLGPRHKPRNPFHSMLCMLMQDQGYPVVTYTKPEALHNLIDDVDSTRVLLAALNWAAAQSAKTPKSPSDSQPEWASVPAADRRFILAGHSRGGKLAALASVLDPRVVGGVLLDPVDGSYEIEQSER